MEKREREPFSCESQPKLEMRVTTYCERTQPHVVGIDARGEFIWEAREMPRWQMEMFRLPVDMSQPFFFHWVELAKYETMDKEFSPQEGVILEWLAKSKKQIDDLKRLYPRKRKHARRVTGD